MRIRCASFTHRGLQRESNEDSLIVAGWLRTGQLDRAHTFDVAASKATLFAVADGLGGHASGEVASLMCLARLETMVGNKDGVNAAALSSALGQVHRELVELSSGAPSLRGMGTTVAGLVVVDHRLEIFNVGDSRVYRLEDRYLQLVSKDDRVATGDYGDNSNAAKSNALLQCIGGDGRSIEPHLLTLECGTLGDTFLICSDGLHDYVPLDEIEGSISEKHDEWIDDLFKRACAHGAGDNITILVLRIVPAEGAAP